MKSTSSIGVAIMTLNSASHLKKCLPPLLDSPLHPRVLVMDSSSDDATVSLAKKMGAETLIIPRKEFNHGLSREKARKALNVNFCVFATPDAYAADRYTLGKLLQPLLERKASLAYAKQEPHEGANFFEAFPRLFNYPADSHIRSLQEIDQYGVYSFFCSNSFAAYACQALDEIGGFTETLLGEDTLAAAKLLRQGHKIAYVAEAIVKHSHRYTLRQEFCRYFDTGLSRQENRHLLRAQTSDQSRGAAYTKEMIKRILKETPWLLPYAGAHLATKWFGYTIGKKSARAPLWFKRALSSQKFYWDSEPFLLKQTK